MVANILPADDPLTLGMGSVGQNSTFSEHGHVAYQIRENQECSNMAAKILPADPYPPPPPTLRIESVGQNSHFQNMVMLHIKLKGSTNFRSMVANILPADTSTHHPTPPTSGWGQKNQKSTFSEHGHVAY